MKRKVLFLILSFLGLCSFGSALAIHAQEPARKLTVLFSNNINGEIDPCPT